MFRSTSCAHLLLDMICKDKSECEYRWWGFSDSYITLCTTFMNIQYFKCMWFSKNPQSLECKWWNAGKLSFEHKQSHTKYLRNFVVKSKAYDWTEISEWNRKVTLRLWRFTLHNVIPLVRLAVYTNESSENAKCNFIKLQILISTETKRMQISVNLLPVLCSSYFRYKHR